MKKRVFRERYYGKAEKAPEKTTEKVEEKKIKIKKTEKSEK
jgi:hypothetical protein